MTEFLASLADFAAVRGVTFDPTDEQAIIALEGASETVRSYCGRTFALAEDDTVSFPLSVTGSVVLPDGPTLGVTSVTLVEADGTETELVEGTDYRLEGNILRTNRRAWTPWLAVSTLRIIYDHGYETPPADLARVVMTLAQRSLSNGQAGGRVVSSEAIGTYQVAYDTQAGVASLEDADRLVLEHYSVKEFA